MAIAKTLYGVLPQSVTHLGKENPMTSAGPYGGPPGSGWNGGGTQGNIYANRYRFGGDGYTINFFDGAPTPSSGGSTPRRGASRPTSGQRNNILRNALIGFGVFLLAVLAILGLVCLFTNLMGDHAAAPAAAKPAATAPTQPVIINVPQLPEQSAQPATAEFDCNGPLAAEMDLGTQAHPRGKLAIPLCGFLIADADLYENGTRTYFVFNDPNQTIQRPNGVPFNGSTYYTAVYGSSPPDVELKKDQIIARLAAANYRFDPVGGS